MGWIEVAVRGSLANRLLQRQPIETLNHECVQACLFSIHFPSLLFRQNRGRIGQGGGQKTPPKNTSDVTNPTPANAKEVIRLGSYRFLVRSGVWPSLGDDSLRDARIMGIKCCGHH